MILNLSNLHVARFVPTTSFRPLAGVDHRNRHAVDCRHGRVVFFDYGELSSFVVWDPISGDVKHKIPDVPDVLTQPAVVSASAAGDGTGACDHRGCGGGHFVVAFAGVENIYEDDYYDAHACYYASDTGEWSVHINIHLDHGKYHLLGRAAALVGGALYFVGESGFLLRYRYGLLRRLGRRSIFSAGVREADVLSVIEPPALGKKRLRDVIVMAAEGGGVGLASMSRNRRVTLWAREETTTTTSGPAGVGDNGGQWMKSRVIDLKKLVPPGSDPKRGPCLSCVTEDGGVIYVGSEDGVFAVEVKSSQVKKVYETGKVDILPFASFYTESLLI
nr:unnamed protein product [Digitaria exilis]